MSQNGIDVNQRPEMDASIPCPDSLPQSSTKTGCAGYLRYPNRKRSRMDEVASTGVSWREVKVVPHAWQRKVWIRSCVPCVPSPVLPLSMVDNSDVAFQCAKPRFGRGTQM